MAKSKGTIGEAIQELADRMASSSTMFYIVERALVQACHGASCGYKSVKVNDELVCDTPGYQAIVAVEKQIIADWQGSK